jgi:DNA-binding NarL/FixJ family response regulator
MSPRPSLLIRVLLIDDHAVVRTGLRMLLESQPGLSVVGEAANRGEALTIAAQLRPDILLLDLDLGEDNGLDFLPDLLAAAPGSHVLVLTGVQDPETHQRAIRLGAVGLVLKERAAGVLLRAIERVHAGQVWLDRSLLAKVLGEMTPNTPPASRNPETAKIATLTPREREVVALVGEGLKNKQIADRLYVSGTTVRHHLTSIFAKLGVADRLSLVVYAYRYGLASLPH